MIHIEPHIVQRCKSGDQRAFAELYKRCYSFMLGVSKRYISDDEEAVFQMNTAFATAMCKLDLYDDHASFGGWLRRVLVNSLIDYLRKRKRYSRHIEEYKINTDSQDLHRTVNGGQEVLEFEDVMKLLDVLPEVTKDVFNLFVIDGYKHQEISELLGLSTGTTKWHVSRARKILSEHIGSHAELRSIYKMDGRLKKNAL